MYLLSFALLIFQIHKEWCTQSVLGHNCPTYQGSSGAAVVPLAKDFPLEYAKAGLVPFTGIRTYWFLHLISQAHPLCTDCGGSHNVHWNLAFSICHPAFPRQYVTHVLNDINRDIARAPYPFVVFFNSYVERYRDHLTLHGFDYQYCSLSSRCLPTLS